MVSRTILKSDTLVVQKSKTYVGVYSKQINANLVTLYCMWATMTLVEGNRSRRHGRSYMTSCYIYLTNTVVYTYVLFVRALTQMYDH